VTSQGIDTRQVSPVLSSRERSVDHFARPDGGPGELHLSRKSDLHLPLAYIDAGSGSLIIQAVIATAIAVPIILRNQLRRAANALRRVVGVRSERTEE